MPANLTHHYLKAESAYRRAASPEEELQCLETMLRELPKHKGTDKMQAELKQKISKAKKELQQAKTIGKRAGVRIPRQGAGRAVIIGGPNAGKSQLLASLTRAKPEVAPYPFTTHQPMPGMMPWEDVTVQLIDTQAITTDLFDPTNQALIRGADVVVLMVDLGADEGIEQLQEVLDKINATKTRLARTSYLNPSDVGVTYTQTLLAPNKIDAPEAEDRLALMREFCPLDFDQCVISAQEGHGLEALRDAIYRPLDVVRVYTKLPTNKEPDYNNPFTLRRGGTVSDVAQLVHLDLAKNLKFARVWGSQVHGGTTVKADYVVQDKDVVELHT